MYIYSYVCVYIPLYYISNDTCEGITISNSPLGSFSDPMYQK